METTCSLCHVQPVISAGMAVCGDCLQSLQEEAARPDPSGRPRPEIDRRGHILPRRHLLGGIITPQ